MDAKKFGAFLAVTRKEKDDAGTAGRENRGYHETVIECEVKIWYHERKNRF